MTEWTMTCGCCGASTTSEGSLLTVPACEPDCDGTAPPAQHASDEIGDLTRALERMRYSLKFMIERSKRSR